MVIRKAWNEMPVRASDNILHRNACIMEQVEAIRITDGDRIELKIQASSRQIDLLDSLISVPCIVVHPTAYMHSNPDELGGWGRKTCRMGITAW